MEEAHKPIRVRVATNECFWGACCSHAILTDAIGKYHCLFGGVCFKRIEGERQK